MIDKLSSGNVEEMECFISLSIALEAKTLFSLMSGVFLSNQCKNVKDLNLNHVVFCKVSEEPVINPENSACD